MAFRQFFICLFFQLHRKMIEVGACHIRMRIEPIGAILPISPVYPVRRKRKVEKIPGKSKFEQMLMKLMESEEAKSKIQKPLAPIHIETIPERLEKLKIQNYAIQYILMSESTVYNLIV